MTLSLEDKILALYAKKGEFVLPSVRLREAIKLLNLIDGFNWCGIVDTELPEIYTVTLQKIIALAEIEKGEWHDIVMAEKEIDQWLRRQE